MFLAGCTGLSLGEQKAGQDTFLGSGAIAVDDRTETSFVLRTDTPASGAASNSTLYAVDPDTGGVRSVIDLTGRDDPRVVFPSSGVLVFSEEGGHDVLDLFDPASLASLKHVNAPVRYAGTRLSPSRDWIVVDDNTTPEGPIHLFDAATLTPRMVPHGGDWIEGQWLHQSDRFAAIVFYENGQPGAHARLLVWSMQDLLAETFSTDGSDTWANAEIDVDLAGYSSDDAFSYTWVAVSPDDSETVFPVRALSKQGEDSYALLVLDDATGQVRTVPRAKGPVGFTPDSATIVSYDDTTSGDQQLKLIDAKTLDVSEEPVPIQGGITYFVSHEGDDVVVGSANGGQSLVLYDVESGEETKMAGPGVALTEFVARPSKNELWALDSGALFRVDLTRAAVSEVATDFSPSHLNILPKHDRLVLDATTPDLFFLDPSSETMTLDAPLPE